MLRCLSVKIEHFDASMPIVVRRWHMISSRINLRQTP
jgi:hypothetical protein